MPRTCLLTAAALAMLLPSPAAAAVTGNLWAWGEGFYGELGNGSVGTLAEPVPVSLPASLALTAVTAGASVDFALDSDGRAWGWGNNGFGQVGDGTTNDTNLPTHVAMPAGVRLTQVSSGHDHALALDSTGRAWAWGRNLSGQLGDGTTVNSSTPVQVTMPAGVSFAQVAAGGDFSLGLDGGGRVWTWGYNSDGELGDGSTSQQTTPVLAQLPPGTAITAVAGGGYHALALDSTGRVWAWGFNASGQLGDGTTTSSSTPVQVAMPSGIAVTGIAGAENHSIARASDGTAWAWGNGTFGTLGNGATDNHPTPVQVSMPSGAGFTQIGACPGAYHTLAVDATGRAWGWGDDSSGELGDGGTAAQDAPVAVHMPSGVLFTSVDAGSYHSIALDTNGHAWTWGASDVAGNGMQTESDTPAPGTATDGHTFTSLAAGSEDSFGLDPSGHAWAWGVNQDGQLGNGSTTTEPAPVAVQMPANVTLTSVVAGAASFYASALDTTGHVWAWGQNDDGELGDGTTTSSAVPVPVTMPNGVTFTKIAAGNSHTLALDTTGHLWAWGYGGDGELGDGSTVSSSVPVEVTTPPDVTFSAIAAGGSVRTLFFAAGDWSLAVDTSGRVWSWGFNNDGELGNGTTTNTSLPLPLAQPLNVASVAAGSDFSLALDSSGDAWAWGHSYWGTLGNGSGGSSGSFSAQPVAVTMPQGVTFSALAAGGDHALALDREGRAWAWGRDTNGQLGDGGGVTMRTTPVAVAMPGGISFTAVAAGNDHSLALGTPPPANVPEAPLALVLPSAGAFVAGAVLRRRRAGRHHGPLAGGANPG